MGELARNWYAIGLADARDGCLYAPPDPNGLSFNMDGQEFRLATEAYRNGYELGKLVDQAMYIPLPV